MSAYIKNRKISNKRPNVASQIPRKTKTKPKRNRRKIMEIRAEIKKKETKRTPKNRGNKKLAL
jgi:hypothetical protein